MSKSKNDKSFEYKYQEYPKYIEIDGKRVIVASKDEEDKLVGNKTNSTKKKEKVVSK